MPEKTCGRKYCSPRFKLGEDSLAPEKSRTGNHQLPPQILPRNKLDMLVYGSFEEAQRTGGGIMAEREYKNRHASDFSPGSVTFVGYEPTRMVEGSMGLGAGPIRRNEIPR
jgi:hypothetical protein